MNRLFSGCCRSVIAGEQIAHGGSERKQRHTLRAEEFYAQEYRSERTVDNAAEKRDESDRRGKSGIEPDKSADDAAESRADEESRDYLAALVSRADGDGGEDKFEQERLGLRIAADGALDYIHARAVVIPASADKRQRDDY